MKRILFHLSCLALLAVMPSAGHSAEPGRDTFVRVSPRDPRYLELTDGRPYIPLGFNLVGAPGGKELERVVVPEESGDAEPRQLRPGPQAG
jgi:hypothetical protein